MNTMTYKKRTLHLLLLAFFGLVTALSQPAAAQAQAQSTPTGTGKTISAVLLGTQEPTNQFPWQVSLRHTATVTDPDPDPAAKLSSVHKVSDITLKRGQIG
jgi:hypothetical protein